MNELAELLRECFAHLSRDHFSLRQKITHALAHVDALKEESTDG